LWAKNNSFPSLENFEFALYRSDLELAAMFQFYAVFGFIKLMSEYVGNHNILTSIQINMPELRSTFVEYQTMIKTTSFLGAWAFIIMGLVRTFASFITAELETFSQTIGIAERLEEQMLDSLQFVFVVLTVICVVNMFIVCSMDSVQTKMPNANSKFNGARMLLIFAEVQKNVLSVFTFGSPFNVHIKHLVGNEGLTFFTPEVFFLVHVTLLVWECLAIVIMNFIWWKPWDLDVEKAELTPRFEKENITPWVCLGFFWQLVGNPPGQDPTCDATSEQSPLIRTASP